MSWVPRAELESLRRDKDERIDKLEREVYRLESILKNWHEVADRAVAEKVRAKDDELARAYNKQAQLRELVGQLETEAALYLGECRELRRQYEQWRSKAS